jgi:hypothetical protein
MLPEASSEGNSCYLSSSSHAAAFQTLVSQLEDSEGHVELLKKLYTASINCRGKLHHKANTAQFNM